MADSVQEFIDFAFDAIHGSADNTADSVRGSDYEAILGPAAMVWSRQTRRDTDLFRAIRFLDAEGQDLTDYVWRRYGIPRIEATRGVGTATLTRATTAAGAGTVWKGTRIRLSTWPHTDVRIYRVTADKSVDATETQVQVTVEATETGPGYTVDNETSGLWIDDPLWDTSWIVTALSSTDGTNLEDAKVFRERVKSERVARRPGHEEAIIEACKDVGAGQVVVFRSDYGGPALDFGLNVVYVGDLGYSGSADLVRACTVAMRSVRVAGDCMQVFPMVRAELTVDADITLRDSPAVLPTERLELLHRAAIQQHLGGREGGFTFSRIGIMGAITRHTPEVRGVSFVSPSSDATILVSNNFPSSLNRYVISDANIVLRYQ